MGMNGKRLWCAIVITLGGTLIITACASTPPPTDQIAVSQSELNSAISAGGTEAAPAETKSAQDKLARAKQLMTKKDDDAYAQARALAEEAEVDARLAEAKADTAKSQAAVSAIQEDIRVLNEEMQRQSK